MATQYWLALCTSPSDLHTYGDELTNESYHRASVMIGAQPGTRGVNVTPIVFGTALWNWPEVGWAELWTEQTGGTRFAPATLLTPLTVFKGETPQVAVGGLELHSGPAPYGMGRYGVGRYATALVGTVALEIRWAVITAPPGTWGLSPPCSAGAWTPVEPCSPGTWEKAA